MKPTAIITGLLSVPALVVLALGGDVDGAGRFGLALVFAFTSLGHFVENTQGRMRSAEMAATPATWGMKTVASCSYERCSDDVPIVEGSPAAGTPPLQQCIDLRAVYLSVHAGCGMTRALPRKSNTPFRFMRSCGRT